MKRVSLKDIARLAQVSPATVSFVLNGKAKQMRISQPVAERIIMVAQQEGYQPNQVAVSLRTGKSQMIGLIVESISGNFFASLAKIIEEQAGKFGYRVVYCATENDGEKGQELIKMLSQRQVDGYIITPTKGMEESISKLVIQNKPVVLMDSYFPEIKVPHVSVDNFNGVVEGMNHLVERGYKNIGFVTVDLDLVQIKQREEAYRHCLSEKGLAVADDKVLRINYNYDHEDAIARIASFISGAKKMDAVFFATNYLGLLGLESISRLGLKLPENIALISFDDHEVFRLLPPGVTSIRQPVEQIANRAIEILMERLNDHKVENENIEIPAKLIVRGTT